jgi:ABC-type glycerol-3-phosphate transport system permease component
MPFIVMLVGITLAYGCARLRFPVEPFLLIMASYGWVTLFDRSYYDRVRGT